MLSTQTQRVRVPPPRVPPGRVAGGFAFPEEQPRHDNAPSALSWREIAAEVRRVRWPGCADVAARTLVTAGFVALLALFAHGCGVFAQVLVGA
jgi:hypothetical protein